MERTGERCAFCNREDEDDRWLWLEVERRSPEVEDEFDEIELAFCSQDHAAQFLAGRTLEWPREADSDRSSGTAPALFFLGCGLLAIVLSVVGLVSLVRWLV